MACTASGSPTPERSGSASSACTDGNGLCGWLPYAPLLTHGTGAAALLVDLCGYGASRFRAGYGFSRQTDQVSLAVDHAVRRMHADRVVLVGASMGGSRLLRLRSGHGYELLERGEGAPSRLARELQGWLKED